MRAEAVLRVRRKLVSWRLAGVFVVVFFWALTAPARAEFTVCNQTLDVTNVAIGQSGSLDFRTEGWWTIGANRCVNIIQDVLANRYIYVYATDVFGQPILNGTTRMCVGPKRFVIDGTGSCWERGYAAVPFYEVDTQAVERWTLFLQQPRGN